MVEISALRPGQEVAGVFACTRKDRLMTRGGSPYLALELRDRSGTLAARAFQNADDLGARFERGDVVRVRGRVERFRDELVLEVAEIARVEESEGVDPAASCPPPTATWMSSTASSSIWPARCMTGATGAFWTGCWVTPGCGPRGGAPRARGRGTMPIWAACSNTRWRWPPWPTRPVSSTPV